MTNEPRSTKSKLPKPKLDADKVRAIRQQYSTGVTAEELAKRFGVNRTTIMRVVRHKSWFNVS
jgi:DNA invertase Pin-like site-specific DNA recombinase